MQTDDVRRIIEQCNARLMKWYAAGDIDSVAALFAEEAWQLPPHHPPLIGREAIRNFWREAAAHGTLEMTLEARDVAVSEPIAIERGTYTIKFTARSEASMKSFEDRGNYLVYWRQGADSQWRIIVDAPVSELPLA